MNVAVLKLILLYKKIHKSDPALRSGAEVLLYPGFWAIVYHTVSSRLFKCRLYFLSRAVSQWAAFSTGIEIHPGAKIGSGVFIDHGVGVVIGETSVVGNNVTIYHGVTLGGTGKGGSKRHPTICDNVVIGAGAIVLGNITVGAGAKIGAGAIVVKNVPPNATIVSEPGRNTSTEPSLRAAIAKLSK